MKMLTKGLLGAGAAAAILVTTATPAQARRSDHYDRNRDGISAGEVIAGAVVLGGLVAVIAAADDDRNDYDYRRTGHDNGYNGGYYNRNGGSRAAINQCVHQVERWAGRYSRSNVTQIRAIDRTRYGYRVRGILVVQDGWRGDRHDRHDHGNRYDRGYDQGRFTCYVERGQVIDIDYGGLDQWRD